MAGARGQVSVGGEGEEGRGNSRKEAVVLGSTYDITKGTVVPQKPTPYLRKKTRVEGVRT